MKTLICTKCKQEKPLEFFLKDKRCRCGHTSLCKICRKEWARERYCQNKKRILSQNANYRKTHKRERNEQRQVKRKSDVLYALKCRLRTRLGHLIKGKRNKRTEELLGCTTAELLCYLGNPPYMPAHLDHIVPFSQAQSPEEVEKLFHYLNLQWLAAEDNLKKSDKKTPEGEALCVLLLGRGWIDD